MKLFEHMPFMVWIILSLGILSLLFLAGKKIITLITKRGIEIKGIKVSGEWTEPKTHADCERHNDIMIIESASSEKGGYEVILLKIETIREQMDYAEHVMTNLINDLQKYYLTELKNYLPSECLTRSDDFLSYTTILELFRNRLLDIFRDYCRKNHLAKMDEEEFIKYQNIKALSLLNDGSRYLNELYLHQKNITREKLYDINTPHIQEFLIIIKDILRNARQISIKNEKLLIEKNWELANLLEEFVGKNNPLLDMWKKQHNLI